MKIGTTHERLTARSFGLSTAEVKQAVIAYVKLHPLWCKCPDGQTETWSVEFDEGAECFAIVKQVFTSQQPAPDEGATR